MSELLLRNRQRTRRVDATLLRRVARSLLVELLGVKHYELVVHLIATPEMAQINQTFLGHEGSTDVITFDYTEDTRTKRLHGEIFICLDDAVAQARQFHTVWQSELVRYLVHGVLHLLGYEDLKPAARRVMKREESRLLHELARRFPLRRLVKSRTANR
jgi:rRNA maturation RNase YbeY